MQTATISGRAFTSNKCIQRAAALANSRAQAALAPRFEMRTVTPSVHPNLFACPSAVLRDPARAEAWGMTDPFQPVAGAARASAA